MSEIKTVANQRVVTIKKAPCDKDNLYCCINLECMKRALKELKLNELRLFMVMAMNQPDYTFAFSPQAIENMIGVDKKQIKTVFNSLVDKGYIALIDGNRYEFYEDKNTGGVKTTLGSNSPQCGVKSTPPSGVKTTLASGDKSTLEIVQDNTKNSTVDSTEKSASQTTTTTPSASQTESKMELEDVPEECKRDIYQLFKKRYSYKEMKNELIGKYPFLNQFGLLGDIVDLVKNNPYYQNPNAFDEAIEIMDSEATVEVDNESVEKYSLGYKFISEDGYVYTVKKLLQVLCDGTPFEEFESGEQGSLFKALTNPDYGRCLNRDEVLEWFGYVVDNKDIYKWDSNDCVVL